MLIDLATRTRCVRRIDLMAKIAQCKESETWYSQIVYNLSRPKMSHVTDFAPPAHGDNSRSHSGLHDPLNIGREESDTEEVFT